MFYLSSPQIDNYFQIEKMKPWNYPAHIHSYFEILIGFERDVSILVENQEYSVTRGQAVIVFPYQSHGFIKKGDGYGYLCTFDGSLISSFSSRYQDHKPCSNLIRLDYDPTKITTDSNSYAIKAFLYSICDRIVSELKFIDISHRDLSLLKKILTVTEHNYADETFSLATLAKLLGYDYGYISKSFVRQTGIRYNDYLNYTRTSHAALLLNSSLNISEVALSCGYNSIRSFNRNFKAIYGITPSSFLANNDNAKNITLTGTVKI